MSQTTLLPPPTLHLNPLPVIDLSLPSPLPSTLQPAQNPRTSLSSPAPLVFPTRPINPNHHTPTFPPTKHEDSYNEPGDDFPTGFLNDDWSGFWLFAAEFVRGMQGLLMQWLEGTGRYGWVRHTT